MRSEIERATLAKQKENIIDADTFTAPPQVSDFGAKVVGVVEVHGISDDEDAFMDPIEMGKPARSAEGALEGSPQKAPRKK